MVLLGHTNANTYILIKREVVNFTELEEEEEPLLASEVLLGTCILMVLMVFEMVDADTGLMR